MTDLQGWNPHTGHRLRAPGTTSDLFSTSPASPCVLWGVPPPQQCLKSLACSVAQKWFVDVGNAAKQRQVGPCNAQYETLSKCLASTSLFHAYPMVWMKIKGDHKGIGDTLGTSLTACLFSRYVSLTFCRMGMQRSLEALPRAHLPIFLDEEEEEEKVLVWTVVLLLLLLPSVEKE